MKTHYVSKLVPLFRFTLGVRTQWHRYTKSLVVLVVALLGLAGCGEDKGTATNTGNAVSAQTFQWKLVTTWPKNFPGLGTAPEYFAQAVNAMSAGRLQIKVYGDKELVGAMEVFDAVSRGAAQMGHGSAYYWKGKVPAAQFFTTIPWGLTAQEMNGWLYYGGGMQLWQEIYAPFNLIPMAGGNTGVQMAGWFKKEINSVDDLKGLKIRIPGLAGEVVQRLGGVPVTLPGSEIFTALQTGAIDATEWVGPYNDLTFGLHKAAGYYYFPGWHEPGPTLEFIINKDAFNQLPDDLKAIVTHAARAANQNMLDEYTARNNAALKELTEKHGIQVKPLPPEVLNALRTTTEQVLIEHTEKDPQMKKVYDSFHAFLQDVSEYTRISEQAYVTAREASAP